MHKYNIAILAILTLNLYNKFNNSITSSSSLETFVSEDEFLWTTSLYWLITYFIWQYILLRRHNIFQPQLKSICIYMYPVIIP